MLGRNHHSVETTEQVCQIINDTLVEKHRGLPMDLSIISIWAAGWLTGHIMLRKSPMDSGVINILASGWLMGHALWFVFYHLFLK